MKRARVDTEENEEANGLQSENTRLDTFVELVLHNQKLLLSQQNDLNTRMTRLESSVLDSVNRLTQVTQSLCEQQQRSANQELGAEKKDLPLPNFRKVTVPTIRSFSTAVTTSSNRDGDGGPKRIFVPARLIPATSTSSVALSPNSLEVAKNSANFMLGIARNSATDDAATSVAAGERPAISAKSNVPAPCKAPGTASTSSVEDCVNSGITADDQESGGMPVSVKQEPLSDDTELASEDLDASQQFFSDLFNDTSGKIGDSKRGSDNWTPNSDSPANWASGDYSPANSLASSSTVLPAPDGSGPWVFNRQRSAVQQKILNLLCKTGMDFSTYSATRKWINNRLRELLNGDVAIAYSHLGRAGTQLTSRTKYAEHGEIVTNPFESLERLKHSCLQDADYGRSFAQIIKFPILMKDILTKVIGNARQKLCSKYGPLKRTLEEMMDLVQRHQQVEEAGNYM